MVAIIMHLFHLGYWLMVNNHISAVKFKKENFFARMVYFSVCLCCLSSCLSSVLHQESGIRNQESKIWQRTASSINSSCTCEHVNKQIYTHLRYIYIFILLYYIYIHTHGIRERQRGALERV